MSLSTQAEVEVMSVSDVIQTLNATADAPPSNVTEEERAGLLAACDMLRASLESPVEATVRFVFAVSCPTINPRFRNGDLINPSGYHQTHQSSALRLAIDMKIFDAIAKLTATTNVGGTSIEQLAAETGADQLLISKFPEQAIT